MWDVYPTYFYPYPLITGLVENRPCGDGVLRKMQSLYPILYTSLKYMTFAPTQRCVKPRNIFLRGTLPVRGRRWVDTILAFVPRYDTQYLHTHTHTYTNTRVYLIIWFTYMTGEKISPQGIEMGWRIVPTTTPCMVQAFHSIVISITTIHTMYGSCASKTRSYTRCDDVILYFIFTSVPIF